MCIVFFVYNVEQILNLIHKNLGTDYFQAIFQAWTWSRFPIPNVLYSHINIGYIQNLPFARTESLLHFFKSGGEILQDDDTQQ